MHKILYAATSMLYSVHICICINCAFVCLGGHAYWPRHGYNASMHVCRVVHVYKIRSGDGPLQKFMMWINVCLLSLYNVLMKYLHTVYYATFEVLTRCPVPIVYAGANGKGSFVCMCMRKRMLKQFYLVEVIL